MKLSLARNIRLSINEVSDAAEFSNNVIMLGDENSNANSIELII